MSPDEEPVFDEAVKQLYETLASYDVGDPPLCPCCEAGDVRGQLGAKASEAGVEAIEHFAGKAVSSWGGAKEFKRYLPRILELLFSESGLAINTSAVMNKLLLADGMAWPTAEREGTCAVLIAAALRIADGACPALEGDDQVALFEAIGYLGGNASVLTRFWRRRKGGEEVATVLAEFVNKCLSTDRSEIGPTLAAVDLPGVLSFVLSGWTRVTLEDAVEANLQGGTFDTYGFYEALGRIEALLEEDEEASPDSSCVISLADSFQELTLEAEEPMSGVHVIPVIGDLEGPLAHLDARGHRLLLYRGQNAVLGRAPSCDLVFTSRDVALEHARVVCRDDGFELSPCSSEGPVFVNEAAIAAARALQHGDTIRLGSSSRLEFRLEEPPA